MTRRTKPTAEEKVKEQKEIEAKFLEISKQTEARQPILDRIAPNGTLSIGALADLLLELQTHTHNNG